MVEIKSKVAKKICHFKVAANDCKSKSVETKSFIQQIVIVILPGER